MLVFGLKLSITAKRSCVLRGSKSVWLNHRFSISIGEFSSTKSDVFCDKSSRTLRRMAFTVGLSPRSLVRIHCKSSFSSAEYHRPGSISLDGHGGICPSILLLISRTRIPQARLQTKLQTRCSPASMSRPCGNPKPIRCQRPRHRQHPESWTLQSPGHKASAPPQKVLVVDMKSLCAGRLHRQSPTRLGGSLRIDQGAPRYRNP